MLSGQSFLEASKIHVGMDGGKRGKYCYLFTQDESEVLWNVPRRASSSVRLVYEHSATKSKS